MIYVNKLICDSFHGKKGIVPIVFIAKSIRDAASSMNSFHFLTIIVQAEHVNVTSKIIHK